MTLGPPGGLTLNRQKIQPALLDTVQTNTHLSAFSPCFYVERIFSKRAIEKLTTIHTHIRVHTHAHTHMHANTLTHTYMGQRFIGIDYTDILRTVVCYFRLAPTV